MAEDTSKRLHEAMAFQLRGDITRAEAIYTEVLATEPNHPDATHLLGVVRAEQDKVDEAIRLIEKAIAMNPAAAAFHHNIAGIYRRVGRLDDAEREFRAAIALKPDYGEAYQGLAEMVRFERNDEFIKLVEAQLSRQQIEKRTACYFHFAAGKFFDDIGEYRRAFDHYQRANKAADRSFDGAAWRQLIKDTVYLFSRDYVAARAGSGDASDRPIFVLGMPRSGTTLVEQILASHPTVFGAGELNDMKLILQLGVKLSSIKQAWPHFAAGLQKDACSTLGREYLKRIARISPDSSAHVIDKHPLNFQYLGLILLMFPNARVIHTVRHPLDTCLSCFFQNFTKGQDYTFDLKTLAHFYNDYRRLMEHWETVFPGRILTVRYEDLLLNQEAETRRMLEYCNLAFDPRCLNFFDTQRQVKTASFLQVRKPIYTSSVNRWRNYAPELREMAVILGERVEAPVTVSQTSLILKGHSH